MLKKILTALAILSFAATPIHAQDFTSFAGTIEIQYQPIQSAGVKSGCALTYKAIVLDNVYQHGAPIILSGYISLYSNEARKNAVLDLNIGIKDALTTNPVYPPFFAFIQSANGTTAQSKIIEFDSDSPGYKNFVFQLDGQSTKIFADIMDTKQVTLWFNKGKGSMDVAVPLDLTVEATKYDGKDVNRLQSSTAVNQFASCVSEVIKTLKLQ